ncbi:hypothetical protein P4833_24510 [Pseudomonas aeruginosa]
MSEALHGTVTLVIGARTYILQPTLEAALKIESRFGGLRPGHGVDAPAEHRCLR